MSIVLSVAGCDRTAEIQQQAEAEAAAHRRASEDQFHRIAPRLQRDLAQLSDALGKLSYRPGDDLGSDPRLAAARVIVDELAEAVEARCIEADVVPSGHPQKKDPMSIGITVVGEGAFAIRECPHTVAYTCSGDAYEDGPTTVESCDIEIDESGVKKAGFEVETWQDVGDMTLRMRIAL